MNDVGEFVFTIISTLWFSALIVYAFVLTDESRKFFKEDPDSFQKTINLYPALAFLMILCPLIVPIHLRIAYSRVFRTARQDLKNNIYNNNLQNAYFHNVYKKSYNRD